MYERPDAWWRHPVFIWARLFAMTIRSTYDRENAIIDFRR